MRVALQIDGDASGAVKAATDTSGAVTDLGKQTDAISHAIEDGFKNAVDSIDKLKNASQAAGAANDNTAGSALGLAGKLSQVAGAALGADSALAKGASGAVNFAKGVGDAVRAVGTFNVIGAILGLAVTAASTFYGVVNTGSAAASKALDEQARQVGIVRDAYSDATKTAGDFLTQSKLVTQFQAQQNLIALKAEQLKQVTPLVAGNSFQPQIPQPFGGEASIGFDIANAAKNIGPFQKAIDDLHSSIALGAPDFAAYQDAIAAIGRAAQASNPALAAQAAELLNNAQKAADATNAVKKQEAMLAQLSGTATDGQKKLLGLSTAADTGAGSFDRLSKAMDRQSAAQAAEAQTAGLSAGATARLRTEFILTEAASQSGAGAAEKYAGQIKNIADRAGEAAQKLALAKLQSDTAFNRDQIGRTAIDATVADQLRGAFGNNADLNSDYANAVRFNETMKDLKSTVTDVSNGAFTDFRNAVQGGTSAMSALGTTSINVLNKIIDKLASKELDKGISALFGSFGGFFGPADPGSSAKPLAGLTADDYGPGFAFGGYTGAGGKYQPAGIVHKDEFVFDQDATRRLGAGNLERLRRGYADGGLVGASNPWGNLSQPSGQGGNSPAGGAQGLKISIGVTVDDDGKLKAYVKGVSQQTTTEGIAGYAASPAFIAHVADASNAGKTDRLM